MQSQKLQSFFNKMPDPKQMMMMGDLDDTMDVVAPDVPEPAAPDVDTEPAAQTSTSNLVFSTLP